MSDPYLLGNHVLQSVCPLKIVLRRVTDSGQAGTLADAKDALLHVRDQLDVGAFLPNICDDITARTPLVALCDTLQWHTNLRNLTPTSRRIVYNDKAQKTGRIFRWPDKEANLHFDVDKREIAVRSHRGLGFSITVNRTGSVLLPNGSPAERWSAGLTQAWRDNMQMVSGKSFRKALKLILQATCHSMCYLPQLFIPTTRDRAMIWKACLQTIDKVCPNLICMFSYEVAQVPPGFLDRVADQILTNLLSAPGIQEIVNLTDSQDPEDWINGINLMQLEKLLRENKSLSDQLRRALAKIDGVLPGLEATFQAASRANREQHLAPMLTSIF